MRTLGVTGGIGSGKSTVCRLLQAMGGRLFVADVVARELMEHSEDVRQEVTAAFGPQSYGPELNRAWLASQVFGNDRALARLNAIVHPRVRTAFVREKEEAVRDQVSLLVYEAALIYEAGSDRVLDRIAVVDAPVSVRLQRVMERDKVTEAAVRARIRHQLPPEELKVRADYVIDNSGTPEALPPQVERVYQQVMGTGSR